MTNRPWGGHTMADRPPAVYPFRSSPGLWTGRLDVALTDDLGQLVGTVEIVVRIDALTLWYGNRTLAVIDRDTFREWLIHPGLPFEIDDVAWVAQGHITYLSIDRSPGYSISGALIDYLVAVI